jgi:hypothetical protein
MLEGCLVKTNLSEVLKQIGEEFKNEILPGSRFYREVDIGRKAGHLGFADLKGIYADVYAVILLKQPVDGMKVRIDGRTFVNYAQFESGVVVPGYVAEDAGLPYKPFVPSDSMILNFA